MISESITWSNFSAEQFSFLWNKIMEACVVCRSDDITIFWFDVSNLFILLICNPVDFRYSVVSRNLWSLTDPTQAFRWSYVLPVGHQLVHQFVSFEIWVAPHACSWPPDLLKTPVWTALPNNLNDQEIFLGLINRQSDNKMVKINSQWKCWFPLLGVFPNRKYFHLLDLFCRPRINGGSASFAVWGLRGSPTVPGGFGRCRIL